ncbi:MAG: fused MFS/spermidine synthase, partial [Planctomycetes bacterium]|nr:fused MFS/spermidine synthase [Planctomycetota bacterium]
RYDKESKYYRIRVVDYPAEGRRCLHFSKSRGIQSSMILAAPDQLDLRYSKSMTAAFALHPEPKDVLLVGLGGASIPKFIQKQFPDVRMDIVEIDPDVVKVTQEHFEFKGTPNTRVIVMDGRMYLKRSPKTYDIIMLDAYASDRVPFHLTTREFVELVKSRLKPGGFVVSNLWEHTVNRFYFAELKTFQAVFPQTYILKSGDSGNMILFATLDDKPVTKDAWAKQAAKVTAGKDFGFDLATLVTAEYEYLTPRRISEKPLTDDMAPVDTLRHENPRLFDKEP